MKPNRDHIRMLPEIRVPRKMYRQGGGKADKEQKIVENGSWVVSKRNKVTSGKSVENYSLIPHEEWLRKLHVETKTTLMTLLNIDAKVSSHLQWCN